MEDSALFLQRLAARWAPEQPTLLAPLTANDTYIPPIPATLLLDALLAAHGEGAGEAIASASHEPAATAVPAPATCDRAGCGDRTAQQTRGPWRWAWWLAPAGSNGAWHRWPLLCGVLAALLLLAAAGLCLLFLPLRLRRVPDAGDHVASRPQPGGGSPGVTTSDHNRASAKRRVPQGDVAKGAGTGAMGLAAAEVAGSAAMRLVSPRVRAHAA
jgi:hypothetical protein